MRRQAHILLTILMLLSSMLMQAQVKLEILDKNTGKAVSFAHVCAESMDKEMIMNEIADANGKLSIDTDKPLQIAVTAIGYITLIDTLDAGESFVIHLEATWYSMDEVVVTGQYTPRKADKSIYDVQVINNMKIQEKGATNLTDLLSNELNIRISNDAVLGSSMSIQGLSGEHVKILIDGVPVIGRMNGNIDLTQINLHNVDHIELVEGPMSVIYGSNALAGALNIITKENTRNTLALWQNSYIESVGVYNFDLGGVARYKNSSFSVSGSRNFFSGFSEYDSLRSKQWKPRLQYNLDAYYLYTLNKFRLKLDLQIFDETIQNKGSLLPPYFEKAFDAYFNTSRWTQKLSSNYRFSESKNVEFIFSYSSYDRIKNSYLKNLTDLSEISLPDPSEHDTSEFSAILFRGLFTEEELGSLLSYQLGYDINIESGAGKRILAQEQQIGDYALFASLQFHSASERFSLQPGLRYGYNTNYKSPLVPSLNARWTPDDKILLRASVARGFRAPSLKELYLFFVDINHNLQGNPDLKAEYSNNINLSSEWNTDKRFNQFRIKSSLFYNSIQDRISLAIDSATLYSYVNIDRYNTIGGRVEFRYRMHPRFTFEIGVSEIGRKSSIEGAEGGEAYSYSTDFSTNMSYSWLSKNIVMAVYYKYTGRLPQFYRDESGQISEGYISSFHTMDVSLNKSFWSDRINLGIGGKNLFDYKNIESVGIGSGAHTGGGSGTYPVGWGRTLYVSMKFQINKY